MTNLDAVARAEDVLRVPADAEDEAQDKECTDGTSDQDDDEILRQEAGSWGEGVRRGGARWGRALRAACRALALRTAWSRPCSHPSPWEPKSQRQMPFLWHSPRILPFGAQPFLGQSVQIPHRLCGFGGQK